MTVFARFTCFVFATLMTVPVGYATLIQAAQIV